MSRGLRDDAVAARIIIVKAAGRVHTLIVPGATDDLGECAMGRARDDAAAAEWAEHEMALPHNSASAVRGEEAAAYGRSVLADARRGDDHDLESDAYARWATRNAAAVWSELD